MYNKRLEDFYCMKRIFIDGRAGTTGLRIEERLALRSDIELIVLPEEKRKDATARAEAINRSDVTFLCLPDAAAIEAVSLVKNPDTIIIDASTAHRTKPGWAYGFPELGAEYKSAIQTGKRIAVPGCHASGFIALVQPLIKAGLLKKEALLSCFSLTGFTGGGKAMIAQYEDDSRTEHDLLSAPRQYALGQSHKHLPEMAFITGLQHTPVFSPIVADYDCGMEVTVPLHNVKKEDVLACYCANYAGAALLQVPLKSEDGFLSANALRGRDSMQLTAEGNDERLLLIARFDNLGKGASGAAVQCLNLAIGANETEGLVI